MVSNSAEEKFHFFLDETGDHGLSFVDPNFPLFLLAGCLFADTELKRVEKEIDHFKKEFFGTTEVVLHSREIRKCEGAFQILFDLSMKEKFYNKLNKIITDADFTMVGAAVDKEKHIKIYGKGAKDPYSISLSFILERLIFCLDGKSSSAVVDIKIEKRGKREDAQLLSQLNSVLDRGTYYVESQRLKNRVSDFSSSWKRENIIGLQIADLCAYPLARHILNPKEPYIPFRIIEKKLYCDKNGKYDGYGLKVFP